MHPDTALCAAVLGGLLGPTLAGLTRSVPAPGSTRAVGWWRGAPAGARRIAGVTVAAVVLLGLTGGAIGWRAWLPAYLWLTATAVVLTVVDVEHHRLPDVLTLPLAGAGLVLLGAASAATGAGGAFGHALIGAAVVFAGFFGLTLAGAVGFGDTKLAGALGLYLGWLGFGPLLVGLVGGFALGAVAALALVGLRRAGWRTEVAFGPALLAGALVAVAVGRTAVDAYLGTV